MTTLNDTERQFAEQLLLAVKNREFTVTYGKLAERVVPPANPRNVGRNIENTSILYLVDEYKKHSRAEGNEENDDEYGLESCVILAGTEGKKVAYYTTKYERKRQYRDAAIRYSRVQMRRMWIRFRRKLW